MSMNNRILVLAFVLALTLGAVPLSAQPGAAGGGLGLYGFGPRLGENVQLALENQTQLGLSSEQVASLQELQRGIEENVRPVEGEIENLRARVLAGEVNRVDGLSELRTLLAEYQAAAAPFRTGVAGVLTAEQHAVLQGMMWNSWPGQRMNPAAMAVPGLRQRAPLGPPMGLGPGAYGGWGRGAGVRPYGGRGPGFRAYGGGGMGVGRGGWVRGGGRGWTRRWR